MFMNISQTVGSVIMAGTEQTFGSIVLSLGVILLILLALAVLFHIPLEFTAIIFIPLLLSYMAYYGQFLAIGTVFFIYIALIFTRKFLFK